MMRGITRRSFSLALLSSSLPAMRAMAQVQPPLALEIGLLPNISVRTLMAQYKPLREYLERELHGPVQLSTANSWAEFLRRVLAYEYDVIVTAIHVGRLAQVDRGYRPLAQLMPDIECLLVCAAARPLVSVAALRGKTLVLSNPQSLVAVHGLNWLAGNGLRQQQDFAVLHTPTDDSVGNLLVRGDAVAAIISSGEFRAIPEAVRTQLQVVNRFARVPGFVILANPRLAADATATVQAALLAFDDRSAQGRDFAALTGLQGIRPMIPGLMESMDPLVGATRKLLSVPA